VAYPITTIYVIVLTANHYFADAIAGLLVLAVSYVIARVLTTKADERYLRRRALAGRDASAAT